MGNTVTHHRARLSALLRSTLIVTLALAAGSAAFAQITVTNATFPAAGDTLRMAIDNSPSVINLVYTPPGFGLTWDLSGLQATETKTFIYRPAAEGLVAFRFPGAELVMTSPPSPDESYYDVTGTEFSLQAFHGTGPYDVVTSKVFVYTPPLRERAAPLNFFDVRQSSSGILAALHPSDFPPALIAALPVSPDSLRYRVAFNELQSVDAFGTLILPDGSYSVLRQKQTAYRETRLDAKIPPLGWLDITDIALQAGFAGVGVDTAVTLDFYDDTQKFPIVSVELNAAQNAAVRTLFKSRFSTLNPVYVDAVMASDPLLYWSFEEPGLDPAQDRVTQLASNALVPQQGATRAESMPGLGSAASFNGTHDFAQTQPRFYADALSLGGPTVFDHYAIEMWVKLNDASGIQYLLEASSPSSANAPALIHGFSSNAGVPALEYYGPTARTGEAGPSTLNDNQWHHLVIEADVAANTHTLYVDGQLALQAPGAVAWQLPSLGVGATAYWDGLHGVDGLIDELAFYDLSSGPTTGARIASHYYLMFAATSTPPASSSNTRPVLHPSVPNPFNPSTAIRFDLPRAGRVELAIYDVAGRRVRTLVQESMGAGSHEVVWHGIDEDGRQVASGVYLYRLRAGSYAETRRMTLLK